jgi:hypothetical protein
MCVYVGSLGAPSSRRPVRRRRRPGNCERESPSELRPPGALRGLLVIRAAPPSLPVAVAGGVVVVVVVVAVAGCFRLQASAPGAAHAACCMYHVCMGLTT